MKSIAVFCGSSKGSDPEIENAASLLGKTLAERGIGIVYGGTHVGLMGVVANAALSYGGKVTGVLPDFLKGMELAHKGLTRLITVKSMHERKTTMNDLSDGVIALPGGFGTMDELFEMLTWGQLGIHSKPVALLNVNGYYDDLLNLIKKMSDRSFLKVENQQMVLAHKHIETLLEMMINYQAPGVAKWISKGSL